MKKFACGIGSFGIVISFMIAASMLPATAAPPSETKQEALYFNRLAVAPFLVGHRQPQMDASMDDTLSCPLDQVCSDDPSIAAEAGATLTRLVLTALKKRFRTHLVQPEVVDAGFAGIRIRGALDTPRTLARQLGRSISADLMIIGVVWRYRHRDPMEGVPKIPASVAFAIYLVDVQTGRRLWRGIYNGTQAFATQNILNISKQLKMGARWLTAAELAELGVREALSSFPERITPVIKKPGLRR